MARYRGPPPVKKCCLLKHDDVGIDARQQRRGWHELETALASMRCGANDDMHAKGLRKYPPEQSIPTQALVLARGRTTAIRSDAFKSEQQY